MVDSMFAKLADDLEEQNEAYSLSLQYSLEDEAHAYHVSVWMVGFFLLLSTKVFENASIEAHIALAIAVITLLDLLYAFISHPDSRFRRNHLEQVHRRQLLLTNLESFSSHWKLNKSNSLDDAFIRKMLEAVSESTDIELKAAYQALSFVNQKMFQGEPLRDCLSSLDYWADQPEWAQGDERVPHLKKLITQIYAYEAELVQFKLGQSERAKMQMPKLQVNEEIEEQNSLRGLSES